MWTLASLMSMQFRDLTEPLYREARQTLDSFGASNIEKEDTEVVQAWVLLSTYESMRAIHRQAWMSAGQAFRLLQGMRFHEIDSPRSDGHPTLMNEDLLEIEEKRRVFWMAYFLDHLLSIRNDWPITLNEHVVREDLKKQEQNSTWRHNSYADIVLQRSVPVCHPQIWNFKMVSLCLADFCPK